MITAPNDARCQSDFDLGAPLLRRSLPQEVALRLQHLIKRKKFPNGSRLPSVRDLSVSLGASQSVVREGIRILEGLGIVTIHHGKGIFVLDSQALPVPDYSQLNSANGVVLARQAIQALRCVEVEISMVAAGAATSADLRQLQAWLDEADQKEFWAAPDYRFNLEFEILLGKAAHNEYLIALQKVAHKMFSTTITNAGVMQRLEDRRQHIKKILVAVQFGNAERAGEQTTEYFNHLLSQLAQ